MIKDGRDRMIAEHINALSQKFGIHTVAEYIEDEDTHRLVKQIRINYAQGYHYGYPTACP